MVVVVEFGYLMVGDSSPVKGTSPSGCGVHHWLVVGSRKPILAVDGRGNVKPTTTNHELAAAIMANNGSLPARNDTNGGHDSSAGGPCKGIDVTVCVESLDHGRWKTRVLYPSFYYG